MNNCVYNWTSDRKTGRFATANKVKSVTSHEVINSLASYGVTESYDLPEGVYEREILPIAPLLHGVKEAFADPDTGMAPAIMEIDPKQIDDYYSVCESRIASLMGMEQPDSPAAQRKAVEMYRNTKKPFEVYPGMTSVVMDYQNIMGFLVLPSIFWWQTVCSSGNAPVHPFR
ncbi:hypothetical protein D5281_17540 [bacterium 1xD42-62]|uniref:Uncharacterized protein n=1 Tax=Parablautia muri TaxID=2320879 RepID=A0A9X5BIN3_9FIRM|nr:hypothetical protein [Parablautia muri]